MLKRTTYAGGDLNVSMLENLKIKSILCVCDQSESKLTNQMVNILNTYIQSKCDQKE